MNQYINPWRDEEINRLINNYIFDKDITSLIPNRTYPAILHKASRLGIRKRQNAADIKEKINNTKITSDVAYVVGALMGDGCFLKDINQIQFSVTSKEFVEEFKKRLKRITGIDYKIGKKTVTKKWEDKIYHPTFYTIRCSRKGWFEYFKVLTKKPELLLSKNIVILKSFIKGYIDAEGCANFSNKCISVGNTNKKHIDLLEKMLRILGFHTNRVISRTTSNKPYYYLNIHSYFYIQKYAKEIGFSDKKKQEKAIAMNYKVKRWTEEEIIKLREEYPKIGSKIKINRTEDCIRHKANELNIKHMGWKI